MPGWRSLLEGMSATEFMLCFTITNPDVHTTIVGTLNPTHLPENIAAVLQGLLPIAV
jgi:aryl-alcohol dehydrogenase-like predicted oxidoreductase